MVLWVVVVVVVVLVVVVVVVVAVVVVVCAWDWLWGTLRLKMYCPSRFRRVYGGSFVRVHVIGKPGFLDLVRNWIVAWLGCELRTIAIAKSRLFVVGSRRRRAMRSFGWMIWARGV